MSVFGLGVNLSTSQKLTPQMQQAIKLLQLSSLELEQEVQMKLESNPLLERIDDDGGNKTEELSYDDWSNTWEMGSEKSTDEGFDEPPVEDMFDKLSSVMDDTATDSDWQLVYGDEISDGFFNASSDDDTLFEGATHASIQDHVRWQMNFKHLSDFDKLIADRLIDGMDEDGFIRVPISEVVDSFATILSFYEIEDEIGEAEVLVVLKRIQSCHPVGVGARDLTECLLIQLSHLPEDTEYLTEAQDRKSVV